MTSIEPASGASDGAREADNADATHGTDTTGKTGEAVARRRGEILVTGAAGFIGSHIVRVCGQAGWAVTALDVRTVPPAICGPAIPVEGAANNSTVLHDVRNRRYSAVLHQAAVTSTLETDWELLRDVNIGQSLALAQACAAGDTTFVYASSHSVYGTIHRRIAAPEGAEYDRARCSGPLNLYARSKLEFDTAMAGRAAGSPHWIGLRYTNVFGPDECHKGPMASIISQLIMRSAERRRISLFADTLPACRDYIPVRSVADTVVDLLDHPIPSGVYNLGSGQPISFATLLEWCADFAGAVPQVSLVPNPIPDRYQYWTCADLTKIRLHLPGFRPPAIEEIRAAAKQLFRQYQAVATGPAATPR